MIEMKSTQRHEYGGRWLEEGEVFQAEDAHVTLLTALKRAERTDGQQGYTTRAMEPGRASQGYQSRNARRNRSS